MRVMKLRRKSAVRVVAMEQAEGGMRKTGCGRADWRKSALWSAQTAARVKSNVLQAELGCGRKFGRCAIGCSACWQNVDGGLAGTVSANGLGTGASHGHVLWLVLSRRRFVRIAPNASREQQQTAGTVAVIATSGGTRPCIQTTRSTRLAPARWATALEPVESSATRKRSLALSTAQVSNSAHAASRPWRGRPAPHITSWGRTWA
jgi:hypothetical protein